VCVRAAIDSNEAPRDALHQFAGARQTRLRPRQVTLQRENAQEVQGQHKNT